MNIGLIGCGTIGQGVVKVIEKNKELIKNKTGIELNLKAIADIAIDKIPLSKDYKLSNNPDTILEDKDIDVVIELIGGIDPAKSIITKALQNKKHVVTANKAVISEYYTELVKIAKENNVNIKFEASAGGCVPIIKSLNESLVADEIKSLFGILNGTTNFILTKMADGKSYNEALKEAQKLGFAEADPTFDVSGKDAAQKLVILTLMAFNVESNISNAYVEGIEKITKKDIDYAKELGYSIKLLAIAKKENGKVEMRVHPVLIPQTHLIATVRNELNAVFVKGMFIDEQMYYGKGAGQLPTAAVVVSDVVDIYTHKEKQRDLKKEEFIKIDDIMSYYYVRFTVLDKAGVLAKITKVLAENNISILSVVQKETEKEIVPVVMLTHKVKESSLRKAIEEINNLDVIKDKSVVIRIEGKL